MRVFRGRRRRAPRRQSVYFGQSAEITCPGIRKRGDVRVIDLDGKVIGIRKVGKEKNERRKRHFG